MKSLVKCLLVPAVVIAGMIMVGADRAEAHRWARRPVARVFAGYPHYYPYARPYWRPGVHVYAPGVRVNVGPWGRYYGYGYYGYGYRGSVVAPGVHVVW